METIVDRDVTDRLLDFDKTELVRERAYFVRESVFDNIKELLEGNFGRLGATGGFPCDGDFEGILDWTEGHDLDCCKENPCTEGLYGLPALLEISSLE